MSEECSMDKKKLVWRVYRIESENDLKRAIAQYHTVTGISPALAQVSEKAPDDILTWITACKLEIVKAKNVLPRDVWLTHTHPQGGNQN